MSFIRIIAQIRYSIREYQRRRTDRKIIKLEAQSVKLNKETKRVNLEAKAIEQNNIARQANSKAKERLKKAKSEAGSSSMLGAFFSKKKV